MKHYTICSRSLIPGAALLWTTLKHPLKALSICAGILALAMPAHATVTVSTAAVGSATNFPTTSISGANGTRAFSDVGTASGATFATGLAETRWNTNGVAWGEVFKWTGTTGDVLSSYSIVVNTVSTGSFRPFLYDLGAVTFNATGSTFNPSAQTNRLSNVTLTLPTIAANTFVEFDLTGTDAIALTNGHSYAFGLLNTTTGNIVILRSNGVTSDTNGAPFQITTGGLSGTSATVPSYGAGVRNNFIAVYTGQATPVIPPTPTGLTATASSAQVSLGWSASTGATSYNVKRATTSGGPYTTVTSVTTTSFTDTGLTNGTTYYYVVSAVNIVGESANSSQASATPAAGGGTPPLVYSSENTGASFANPPFPVGSAGPSIPPLPDPFAWGNDPINASGTRSTAFSDWEHHRNEARAYIENYEIGTKEPVTAGQVTATYSGGTLSVHITVNGKTCNMTCAVSIPSGATAPYKVCIGMNAAYGSLGSSPFTSRGIASVVYSHDQVTTYGNPATTNPYYTLYPDQNLTNAGQYSAWAWGVSRIIDGLALVKAAGSLNVDMNHICVTGCSYAGKMALFSGAFDERVALTIAQESGGGGDTSWRYSATEPSGTVEHIDNTDYRWFKDSLKTLYGAGNQKYLPDDHHMLMAMCAPRALYCTGNTDYTWLSNPSAYVCGQACAKVYSTLGIADRFGFNVDGGHSHCAFPSDQASNLSYFLDKFMLDQTSLSQTIRVAPSSYSSINYARWTQWWGTSNPVLP